MLSVLGVVAVVLAERVEMEVVAVVVVRLLPLRWS
jgi:hypothetical protein